MMTASITFSFKLKECAHCRFCDHVSRGDSPIEALRKLGHHVELEHPKEFEEIKNMEKNSEEKSS